MIKNKLVKFLASIVLAFSVLLMPMLIFAAQPKVDFSTVFFDGTQQKPLVDVTPVVGDRIIFHIAINSNPVYSYSNVKIKINVDKTYLALSNTSFGTGYTVGEVKAKSTQRLFDPEATLMKLGDFKVTVTVTADNSEINAQEYNLNFSGSSRPTQPLRSNDGGSCVIDGFNTSDTKLCNPLPDKNLGELVYRLINYILIGISSMAIVTVVIAAFIIVSSQGNEEAIKGAKTSISWAVVGIVLALLAYSIASIIESAVTR
ncbi:MAG: pilin [Patescibacteria group bacterium]